MYISNFPNCKELQKATCITHFYNNIPKEDLVQSLAATWILPSVLLLAEA